MSHNFLQILLRTCVCVVVVVVMSQVLSLLHNSAFVRFLNMACTSVRGVLACRIRGRKGEEGRSNSAEDRRDAPRNHYHFLGLRCPFSIWSQSLALLAHMTCPPWVLLLSTRPYNRCTFVCSLFSVCHDACVPVCLRVRARAHACFSPPTHLQVTALANHVVGLVRTALQLQGLEQLQHLLSVVLEAREH